MIVFTSESAISELVHMISPSVRASPYSPSLRIVSILYLDLAIS